MSQPKVRFKNNGDLLEVVEGGAVDIASGEFKIGGVVVTASAAELNVAAGAAIPDAADVPIDDAGELYAAENVEAALQEIAGAGRTNETVKSAADAAAAAYVKPAEGIPAADMDAAAQAALAAAETALQPGDELAITEGTPVNAVGASKVLAISGVVIHGETVTVGDEVYEFAADAAQSVSVPTNIPVDIEADTTKAAGTLTVDTQPTAGDTMTIGEKVFTFVPAGTANADGEISVGNDLATAKAAIVAAINGADGHNDPHPLVSAAAFDGDTCLITALAGGVAGDSIATAESFTAGSNVFSAAMGVTVAGVDCIAADAAAALVAAITAESAIADASADGGDVTVSAVVKGVSGNSIAISEDMANGAWAGAATELSGGVDGTPGEARQVVMDSSWLYVCIAENDITGANWRRVTLGTAY